MSTLSGSQGPSLTYPEMRGLLAQVMTNQSDGDSAPINIRNLKVGDVEFSVTGLYCVEPGKHNWTANGVEYSAENTPLGESAFP